MFWWQLLPAFAHVPTEKVDEKNQCNKFGSVYSHPKRKKRMRQTLRANSHWTQNMMSPSLCVNSLERIKETCHMFLAHT